VQSLFARIEEPPSKGIGQTKSAPWHNGLVASSAYAQCPPNPAGAHKPGQPRSCTRSPLASNRRLLGRCVRIAALDVGGHAAPSCGFLSISLFNSACWAEAWAILARMASRHPPHRTPTPTVAFDKSTSPIRAPKQDIATSSITMVCSPIDADCLGPGAHGPLSLSASLAIAIGYHQRHRSAGTWERGCEGRGTRA
jgi:hypothetical protein